MPLKELFHRLANPPVAVVRYVPQQMEVHDTAVVVHGVAYLDNQIAQLVGADITDWQYLGTSRCESDIYITHPSGDRIFYGDDALPRALAFIAHIAEEQDMPWVKVDFPDEVLDLPPEAHEELDALRAQLAKLNKRERRRWFRLNSGIADDMSKKLLGLEDSYRRVNNLHNGLCDNIAQLHAKGWTLSKGSATLPLADLRLSVKELRAKVVALTEP